MNDDAPTCAAMMSVSLDCVDVCTVIPIAREDTERDDRGERGGVVVGEVR